MSTRRLITTVPGIECPAKEELFKGNEK